MKCFELETRAVPGDPLSVRGVGMTPVPYFGYEKPRVSPPRETVPEATAQEGKSKVKIP